MKVTISIECNHQAFYEWNPSQELKRILADLAKRVGADGIRELVIRDANGNTVGSMEVTE